MAITRERKEQVVSQVKDAFDRSRMTVLVDYKGLTVKEAQELRKQLSDENVGYTVAKNTLIKTALKQTDSLKGVATDMFEGPVALAFGFEDEVVPAQLLAKFAKDHEVVELKGAIDADGNVLDSDQVKQLAQLPSKEQLRGMVVGTVAAPLSGLANVMAGNVRGLMNVLNAKAKEA